MPVSEQGVTLDRYMLIPRTMIFLRRGNSYLLLKGAATKRLWAGKYNGLGGHVEIGEDMLSSAKRELQEEAGVEANLWLCGTVIVDSGQNPGICLFVFSGDNFWGKPKASIEGTGVWVDYDALDNLPVVEDLPYLLRRIHHMRRGDTPFSARSFYDDNDHLVIEFSD